MALSKNLGFPESSESSSGMSAIPPSFHSLEHDEPFRRCLTCEGELQAMDHPYTVTKVFKGPECVFEYAMCLPCRRKLAKSFSEESQKTMQDFFEKNPHLPHRNERLTGQEDHQEWIRQCATCATPIEELTDYSLACMGLGSEMVIDPFPMMVCSRCEEDIQGRLSKSTREQWDKFILDNFDGPPADSLKPDGVPILV